MIISKYILLITKGAKRLTEEHFNKHGAGMSSTYISWTDNPEKDKKLKIYIYNILQNVILPKFSIF